MRQLENRILTLSDLDMPIDKLQENFPGYDWIQAIKDMGYDELTACKIWYINFHNRNVEIFYG